MTDKLLIDRATLERLLTELQRMSNACELEGDKHRDGNKWHRLSDDAARALSAGRAALANAEPDTTQRDAELWRAYKARKDAVINAGMVSKVMRTGPTEYMKVQDTL